MGIKHNIDASLRWIGVATIIAFPLQAYHVVGLPAELTLDRIMLGLWMVLYVGKASLQIREASVTISFVLSLPFVASTILSVASARLTGVGGFGALPITIVSCAYFLVAFYLGSDSETVMHSYRQIGIGLTVLLTSFAVYLFYHLLVIGSFPAALPLVSQFPFLDGRAERALTIQAEGRWRLGALTRLSIPFSRPQDYGMVAGLSMWMILLSSEHQTRAESLRIRRFLEIVLSSIIGVLVLLSGSRSAFVPLLAVVLLIVTRKAVNGTVRLLNTERVSKNDLRIIFFGVGLLFLVAVLGFRGDVIRLNANLQGHYIRRIDALIAYSEAGILEKFAGYGTRSSPLIIGKSHPHMSFLTVLLEQGLLGLIAFCIPLGYAVAGITMVRSHSDYTREVFHIALFLFFLILTHMLYEFSVFQGSWIASGFICGRLHFLKCIRIRQLLT